MVELLEGVVTKAVGGVFTVETEKAKFTCFSPKKLRYNEFDVLVGDKVKFVDLHKGLTSASGACPAVRPAVRPPDRRPARTAAE